MEASLVGALRIVFILIVIYYVFKLLVRFVFPYLVKRYVNNAQQKFYEANPHLDPNQKTAGKDGEIKYKRTSGDKSKNKPDDFGEYIDYEEVKD